MFREIFSIKTSQRSYHIFEKPHKTIFNKHKINFNQRRGFIIYRIITGLFKLRYLAIAGTASGGYYVNKKYEQIKEAFPDLGQYKLYLPEPKTFDNFIVTAKSKFNEFAEINKEIANRIYTGAAPKLTGLQHWVQDKSEQVSNHSVSAAGVEEIANRIYTGTASKLNDLQKWAQEKSEEVSNHSVLPAADVEEQVKVNEINHLKIQIENLENEFSSQSEAVEKSQMEVLNLQAVHDKEKAKLEDEIKELRRQLVLSKQRKGSRQLQIKKSLIEMYSEVLDELDSYDTSYNAQDHLPRVVVVGEQSAGKTSVLEMVAQARLFPRGAGTMMTRAPVKVTLAEGPFRVAKFDGDDGPEYDLSTNSGQVSLRAEIEARMDRLAGTETIARQPISLSVRGPNLNRMVLVDLPGVINTVTSGMQADTKDSVLSLAKHYMSNPNAIILCIQDASKDAESSSIVDLVSSMDPHGKRTIFVLTKVDQAESQLSDPNRIKELLAGKVFKMKALGYFAVVTGKGNIDESISSIKTYEEEFFKNSKLFRDGVMKLNQMTTDNLSKAVSDLFWKMVRESVEHQADLFKALKFNMENEWKNKYSGVRELDRNELFERARGEILDNLINLSTISPTKWEDNLTKALWEKIKSDIFTDVYIPAHESSNTIGHYKTTIENQLKPWAEKRLTVDTINIGWEVMKNALVQISKEKSSKPSKELELFKTLKEEVQIRSFTRHQWDSKADSTLKIIQYEALNDVPIKTKSEWDEAVKFLSSTLENHLASIKKSKSKLQGPGFLDSWKKWQSRTPTQRKRCAVFDELSKILENEPSHKMSLSADELTTIKRNLQMKKIDVDSEFVQESWMVTYKEFLFEKAKERAKDCQKGFYHYHFGFAEKADFDCRDVVFFRRILRMLETSSAALRNQIMNNEMRRMESIVKSVLDEIGTNPNELKQLLSGEKVTLAENLKRVRQIQEKLDEFITALNKDK